MVLKPDLKMARQISASNNCRVFLLGVAGFLSAAVLFMLTGGSAAWLDRGTVYQPQVRRQDDYERMDLDRNNERHIMPTMHRVVLGVGEEEMKVTGLATLQDQAAISHIVRPNSRQSRLCTPIPKSSTTKDTPSGVKIIILASMRTGSSFVGEMFGQNSDIFYLFEPGFALQTTLHQRGAVFLQPLYFDLLDSLYQCNLTGYEYYSKWLSRQVPERLSKEAPPMYRVLCSKSNVSSTVECGKVSPEIVMRTCRDLNKVAIKSIRISDIGSLSPLIQDKRVNLKVIHLVRDPRGMIASRVLAKNEIYNTAEEVEAFTDGTRASLIDYCRDNLHNKDAGTNLPKFRDNYLLLRYENVSLDPQEAVRRIYNFTGLGAVPENVSKWIREHTSAHVPGTFSTSRVSSQAYQSWRKKLKYATIKTIEEVGTCTQMMQRFGYLPAEDQEHLTNLNISLLSDTLPDQNKDMYSI